MKPINHRREANRLLSDASFLSGPTGHPVTRDGRLFAPGEREALIAQAQVHATLAAGDTTAADVSAYRAALTVYRSLIVAHIANGLALGNDDEHRRSRTLAAALGEAGLNVDDDVTQYLRDDEYYAPSKAWRPPSVRHAEADAVDVPF